jgi:hypothetical protein
MKLRSIAAFGISVLIGQTALAQPAPAPLPPPPAPPPTVAPPPNWGSGIAPPAQTAQPAPTAPPAARPAPAQPPPALPPPGMQPTPYPVPPPQYPVGVGPDGTMPPPGYAGWGMDQAPMAIGPDGRPRLLPLEMKYDPEKGVPPGYRISEQRRATVAIAGASIFGGLWIASAIAGGFMEDSGRWSGTHGWPMYIPVIGPLITIDSAKASTGGATPLVFLAIGQATGVAMFIAGMVSTEKILKYQFEVGALSITPVAAPLDSGGFGGLQGTF